LLKTSKKVLGNKHPQTFSRIKDLADTLCLLERTNDALELLQPLVETSKKLMGTEHPLTLDTVQHLS
ncbi:hypothetical protein GGU10DRAFT_249158, partial [Lentinula aff. detonsa]